MTGNVNITLQPNEACYVLDDFAVTETPRANSPIWFSSSTNTEKHIASNLSQTINASVIVDTNCASISSGIYRSDTGLYNHTYTRTELRAICSGNHLTFTNIEIEPATASNIFYLTYNSYTDETIGVCSYLNDALITFTTFFSIIVLVFMVGIILMMVMGIEINLPGIELSGVVPLIITIVISGILIGVGILVNVSIGGC
jgi:hypothetical protein